MPEYPYAKVVVEHECRHNEEEYRRGDVDRDEHDHQRLQKRAEEVDDEGGKSRIDVRYVLTI